MNENHVVTQSNRLIEARHMKPLSAREQKIILTMVSMIQPNDIDFKEYSISIKEFSEMLGLKGHAKYEEIKEVALHLQAKTIFIPDEDGFITTNWVASQRYKEGEGIIKLSFSPYLKPYLLQLKTQFTSYKLSNILSLGSGYSIRLYELMKKWQHLGEWEYPVDELKLKFGIEEGTYSRYTHFKNRVLKRAIEEVNEKTDLHIKFTEIKKGRKVEKIGFTIHHSVDKEIQLPSSKQNSETFRSISLEDELRTRLNTLADGYQFDMAFFAQLHQGASLIWQDDAEQELEWLIRYVNEEKTVKNPLGFIKSKITSAWEIHEAGGQITFADLQPMKERHIGRQEKLPEWFTSKEEPKEAAEPNSELTKEKDQLLKKLAEKKERLSKKDTPSS
ncbi:replication initiation protein [Microbacterium sp. APC 3898]|uniref:Replication initiation protein n=2 Tax=Planococcus TaxID=1372 RepID=A0ABT7ZPT8_9BACL|nr:MULTISPECIES: replication initiation protein [Terrabacteria group]MBD8016836.1 replication initiation protein [Planococcus wigleyi]MDN3429172.1 replication initiation protein [Planococcus sp. APC 4016]MDN3501088.1 replication initiation protein [Microbacterium sp. APC 3898]